jgi:hypothetical protein
MSARVRVEITGNVRKILESPAPCVMTTLDPAADAGRRAWAAQAMSRRWTMRALLRWSDL